MDELHSFDWGKHPEQCWAFQYSEFSSMMELFEFLDCDGSGELGREEFVEGLIALSIAKGNHVPREQFMLMKLTRTCKRKFRRIESMIANLESARAQFSVCTTKPHL